MSGLDAGSALTVKSFSANLSQAAGTYDLFTAFGANIFIKGMTFYLPFNVGGLTSVSISSNDTTPVPLLVSTLLAALTGGKNLTAYVGPFLLAAGKKVQYTIVGIGNAGSLIVTPEYYASSGNIL